MKLKIRLFGASLFLLSVSPVFANQTNGTIAPVIATLRCTKSGNDIQLTWTDGTAPFTVGRDNVPPFTDAASLFLVSGIGTGSYLNTGALSDGLNHFYLIADTNTPPIVFSSSPLKPKIGDTVTFQGFGLTGATVYDAAHTQITLSASADSAFSFIVPPPGLTSGPLYLVCSGGSVATTPEPFLIQDVAASGLSDPGHITFDNTNKVAYWIDRNSASTTRIWKFNKTTNTRSAFGTTWPTRPSGLATGLWQGAVGTQVFVTGQPTGNSLGAVFRYDAATGVQTSISNQSLNAVNDSADTRALNLGPDPEQTGGQQSIYTLTMPNNTYIGGVVRNIRFDSSLPPTAVWKPVNISGNANYINGPGGIAINGRKSFFISNGRPAAGSVLSRVEFWQANTAVPPARNIAFTSNAATGILNSAQINLDNPNAVTDDSPSVWVANRGNVNVAPILPGSIIKLNLVQQGSGNVIRPTRQTIELYKGYIDPVRGIMPEYATAISTAGGNYTKFLWVTTDSGVQVYRALREIRVKIWIGNHAGLGFTNLPAATQTEITQWVQDSLTFANNDFAQIGFQIKVDPVFGVLNDDGENMSDYSVAYLHDTLPVCGTTLNNWATANTPDLYTIHVLITHGVRDLQGQPVYDNGLGISATSFVNCGGRLLRFSLVSYGNNLTPLRPVGTPRVSNTGIAHELGHDLIDYSKAKTGQFDAPGGHKSDPHHIMYPSNQFSRALWDIDDDDLINYPGSPEISLFFPEGGAP